MIIENGQLIGVERREKTGADPLDDGNIVWGEDWDLIFPIEKLYSGVIA